jgi:carbamoyl-phosphate synthase large subunit
MPKRTDIKTILIIGAGPIIIGQACEFDYSGAQACKALREEGYRVVLVNSNPATIMTDPNLADATYIEPITPDFVEKVIAKERPDALLPTMGGQTALNTALTLSKNGVLKKYNVELIGADEHAIAKAEDRLLFRDAMDKIGLESPKSVLVHSLEEALKALDVVGLPAIIRPSFTLAGTGGGIAYNREEFVDIISNGLKLSPTHEALVEESVLGWKEYEMEVVRDKADNAIIVCSIENIDPMGIHTGDSITVAPALTLTDKEYQIMRNASLAVLREIGIETGGSNVQFAVNPKDGRLVVIEMNPRVSRSSALASKATGFPIAKIAAKLAVGFTLDELKNDITMTTPASFEPSIDYVVTKMPRFTFEKFPGADALLTTSMKSVGEAMSIGRNFAESVQKALVSMEIGLTGFDEILEDSTVEELRQALGTPVPNRILLVAQGFRKGLTVEEIYKITKIDTWFLEQIQHVVNVEEWLKDGYGVAGSGYREEDRNPKPETLTPSEWLTIKQLGFSDARLAKLLAIPETAVTALRHKAGVNPVYKRVDTCAGEFKTNTSYMYSTYEQPFNGQVVCEANVSDRQKVIILGGGPNRIGQGIEFDYCCVHAAYAMREMGLESIMVNCNPETVSTDYDTSDRLYFEPLTPEHVLELCRKEQSKGTLKGVIVQFGGQTPLKLAAALEAANIPILGTSPDAIDLAEDRERFQQLLQKINLKQPRNGTAVTVDQAEAVAADIGYPVVIRPSYVLGGRAMEIVHDVQGLRTYAQKALKEFGDNPILIDYYLKDAIEVDVDAISDGETVHIAGIMEHIEEAGIHSGDSACALPPYSLAPEIVAEIKIQTQKLAKALQVVGLMNVQFAVKGGDGQDSSSPKPEIYILEVNPRASRTVPFVAKATGVEVAKIAAKVMAGEKLSTFGLKELTLKHVAVKEAVFPFSRFTGVDPLLGPEMKSTGEVMGFDSDFARAYAKAQLGAGNVLPTTGTVFISVKDDDKPKIVELVKEYLRLGFKVCATHNTAAFLQKQGADVSSINKVAEGRPHIVDALKNGDVHLVINTTSGKQAISDSFSIRRTCVNNSIPCITTIAGAKATAAAIAAMKSGDLGVKALQEAI